MGGDIARGEELKGGILESAKKSGVKFVSLQFVDIFGTAKNCEITKEKLEDALTSGLWFDGSSIEGFARIHESDMLLKPDPTTFTLLPWTENKVARIICDVYTVEEKPFEGDPRGNLKHILKKLRGEGFDYKVGPELEFFLFRMTDGPAPNHEPHDAGSYWDLDPLDLAVDAKREAILDMDMMGLGIERGSHEVAPGQHEIGFRYGDALTIADNVLTYKNTVKIIAKKHGLFASFMPKPIFGINGSGMHTHQSIWKNGKNAFFDADDSYNLSRIARQFIAGQLRHARPLAAVVAPTVNSYKRLVPGYEAPVYICWARINRSALIRVPKSAKGRKEASRVELRCPDPSCNPYLAFAAMLSAGFDGIKKKMTPPEPVEENVYHFDDKKLEKLYIGTLPSSLSEATVELSGSRVMREALGGHIFNKLIEIQRKQWDAYRIQVTPWEMERYLPIL
jgi:glutamine synthetase